MTFPLRGTTVLVVAHDVRFTMAVCDTIYVLAEGRVIAEGSPKKIRRSRTTTAFCRLRFTNSISGFSTVTLRAA